MVARKIRSLDFLMPQWNYGDDSHMTVLGKGWAAEKPTTGSSVRVRVTLRLTVSQSVCLSWCRAPSGAHDQILKSVLSTFL
jgi:hypothetical protein